MSLELFATAVFWASLVGVFYIFVGYPLLVGIAAKLWPAAVGTGDHCTTVSVLIAAGNEAHRLPQKLDSLLASAGANQIIEVVVGSDGSTDTTVETLRAYPDERVRVVEFNERRGKSAVLADLIPTLRGDVVLLTDARQHVSTNAVQALVNRFADSSIGVVSGELVFRGDDSTTAAEGVGFYWTYEKFLRKCESRFRSIPGATGALYAVRRTCLKVPPDDAILDDVAIPMLAVEQGVRCVFESEAIAYDQPSQSSGQESIRKRRTIAGVVQLVRQHPRWLVPTWIYRGGNPIWWEFVSHKVARLLAPPLLIVCLMSNVWLAGLSSFYVALLCLHIGFYVAAASGAVTQAMGVRLKAFAPAMMFVTLNWTTVLALCDASRGRFNAAWKRVG